MLSAAEKVGDRNATLAQMLPGAPVEPGGNEKAEDEDEGSSPFFRGVKDLLPFLPEWRQFLGEPGEAAPGTIKKPTVIEKLGEAPEPYARD